MLFAAAVSYSELRPEEVQAFRESCGDMFYSLEEKAAMEALEATNKHAAKALGCSDGLFCQFELWLQVSVYF